MKYHQQVVDEATGSDEVWIIGVSLGSVHERPEPVNLHYPK